jgi:hypothetical protein
MTQLEAELTALRARRRSPSLMDRLRGVRPFDRRSIRQPAERDAYWANVQRRLVESEAALLIASRSTEPPPRQTTPAGFVG